jgi:hypothetical protein
LAEEFAKTMKEIHQETKVFLKKANKQIKTQYDCHQRPAWEYKIGDMVYLEGTNLKIDWPTKKLSDKRYGPFKILEKINSLAYKLELPRDWKIHPVFNESLLTPYVALSFPSQKKQILQRPKPKIIKDKEEYKVEEILSSKKDKKGVMKYLVKWKGYTTDKATWEPQDNVKHCTDLVKKFHQRNPDTDAPDYGVNPNSCQWLWTIVQKPTKLPKRKLYDPKEDVAWTIDAQNHPYTVNPKDWLTACYEDPKLMNEHAENM